MHHLERPEASRMKRALSAFLILWVAFMLINFAWGDWRRACVLLLFPFAFLLANLLAIPLVTLLGVVYGFWKATGRTLGISVEIV